MKSPACCSCPVSRANPQAGVALITVLLIVFLASIAATGLATLQQLAIRRTTVLEHQQQARLYTLGAEQEAMILLARDRQRNETDHPGETWANLPSVLPIEGGAITVRLTDLQGCFNLNNLWRPAPGESSPTPNEPKKRGDNTKGKDGDETQDSADSKPDATAKPNPAKPNPTPSKPAAPSGKAGLEPAQIKILQRLLENLELRLALGQAIADWIDPDPDPQFPDGAEDSDYAVLNPPYLAANRPFLDVSELRLIKDLDREAYAKLVPLVCALPSGTPLNVNTAQAPVLAALGEAGPKPADFERLSKERPADGYKTVDEFLNAARLTVDAPIRALLSVDSRYFLLRAEARVGDGRAMLYSTLYRDENGVRVLRRGFSHQD
ncbi:MAG: type II secretion system minor pseudopilin GspK [Candidatus Contendobacter sp.]|nr:type II secretion system minor pseudopilin GspK [Candidatus Contendobacter sp.]MDG4556201.1 type II secretion system minor pseudopilin GspK [Candidatus Contendobacter sp.]